MGYLFSQMFLLMIGAFLLGLVLGWLIWGRSRTRTGELDAEIARLRGDADRLKTELDACGRARAEAERRLREAEAALTSARARPAAAAAPALQPAASLVSAPVAKEPAKEPAKPKPAAKKTVAPKKAPAPKKVAAPVKPDNLRRLIGIGPVNEKKLHGLGIRTYKQIASWTAADIKRVEDVLEFDGRIERERWIEQAKLLAAGKEKEFLRQFPAAGSDKNT